MIYKKIISVVNEHTASTIMARYAIALAAHEMAELVLYTIHNEGIDETKLLHLESHLAYLHSVALELDIAVTRISEIGVITTLLPKRVETEGADLVFYPLTPGERYGAVLQKHDVHNLLRTIRTDLAIMRVVHMGKPYPQRILIPLGRIVSDSRRRILFLTALAKCFHSHATLFYLTGSEVAKKIPDDIKMLGKELRLHHIAVDERSARGPIGKSITVEVITRHNDLIVLGASERSTLKRLMFGNPAGDVMRKPPCNAILFRAAPEP
jgi:nucleotide-binding universal stress UspA family protein